MKEKPNLSPIGVQEKTALLYALDDALLEAEAELIHSDIKSWILLNFSTTSHQEDFLNALPHAVLAAMGEQTARAVLHRWPIKFLPAKVKENVRSSKWIRSKEEDEVSNLNAGDHSPEDIHTGILIIETGY